jgi:hypothetical protein
MKKVILSVCASVGLLSGNCLSVQAGYLEKGAKGTDKGVQEAVGGTDKGTKAAVGGTAKGVKGAVGGTGKGVKGAVGGTAKGVKETGKFLKKLL